MTTENDNKPTTPAEASTVIAPISKQHASACQRWLYGWFGSFFGIVTTVLLAHALIATWVAADDIWTILAWLLLGAHVLSYVGMCLWAWMLLGAAIPYAARAGKPNTNGEPRSPKN